MAKTKISEYDAVASNNTDVDGINIAEGCPPSGINNAIREVMAHLKDFQSGTSGDSFTNSGTLNVTGNFQLDGSAGTSGQVIVSAGTGTPTWGNAFFAGMIMMWSGSIASIPSGWVLCDGNNSTPDLRDRMVIGAGNSYSVDGTGGSKDAIVVAHTHTGTTSTVGDHVHSISTVIADDTRTPPNFIPMTDNSFGAASANTNGAGSHNHTFTTNSTGSSGTNANLPPYYALAFIMKT